jgi:RNA recognition motif-containing protein
MLLLYTLVKDCEIFQFQILMPVDEHSEKDRPGKVFVGGLTPNINEQDLEKQFSVYGRITEGEVFTKRKDYLKVNICSKTGSTIPVLHYQVFIPVTIFQ